MILQKLMHPTILRVFILIPNRHHPLPDPQILQIPPALAGDQLIAADAPRVPGTEIRGVFLGVGDPVEGLFGEDEGSEGGELRG